MDKTGEHYAKSGKSDSKQQMPHDITYMQNLNKQNSQKQKVQLWLSGPGGWEKRGDVSQIIQTASYKINKFWGFNAQHPDYS